MPERKTYVDRRHGEATEELPHSPSELLWELNTEPGKTAVPNWPTVLGL